MDEDAAPLHRELFIRETAADRAQQDNPDTWQQWSSTHAEVLDAALAAIFKSQDDADTGKRTAEAAKRLRAELGQTFIEAADEWIKQASQPHPWPPACPKNCQASVRQWDHRRHKHKLAEPDDSSAPNPS